MSFVKKRRIHFSDCDPAGIVFYPQYFVLFNDLVEEWLDGILEHGFADWVMRRRFGTPTVHLEADFKAVSRMGDDVLLALDTSRVGGRSFELALRCTGPDSQLRMVARQTIVTISLETYRAIPIPAELRIALHQMLPSKPRPEDGLP